VRLPSHEIKLIKIYSRDGNASPGWSGFPGMQEPKWELSKTFYAISATLLKSSFIHGTTSNTGPAARISFMVAKA
jgi:hypothetical protein